MDRGLYGAQRPKAAWSARGGRAVACGILWALTALTVACAPPAGSRPSTPAASTPILADFNRYCLKTGVEREPVADAKRAGLDVVTVAADPSVPGTPVASWVDQVGGKIVGVTYLGEEKSRDSAPHALVCETMSESDHGLTLKAIDDWLGPGHPFPSGSGHEFQLKGGRAWPLAETDHEAVEAARAAGNYYFLLAFDRKGNTTLRLRRWRGPKP
jgi:hypothetical protein